MSGMVGCLARIHDPGLVLLPRLVLLIGDLNRKNQIRSDQDQDQDQEQEQEQE